MNEQKNYELVKFVDGGFELNVNVSPKENTVWLTQKQMSLLFGVTTDNISLHIKNIINMLKTNEKYNFYSTFQQSYPPFWLKNRLIFKILPVKL